MRSFCLFVQCMVAGCGSCTVWLSAKHDTLFSMQQKLQIPGALEDCICQVGCPDIMVHDGAKEMMSEKWISLLRKHILDDKLSKAHHQNQNIAERCGGALERLSVA